MLLRGLLAPLTLLALAVGAPIQPRAGAGTIASPASGTAIQPGQSFPFFYNTHSDYCISSLNFTVFLLASPPADILSDTATGHYFGRFSYLNLEGNSSPSNPAPAQLTMPDFSLSPGGFGEGASASNLPVYLAVVEEYNECGPAVGNMLHLTYNPLIYNATT